jgi:hypothetical protein
MSIILELDAENRILKNRISIDPIVMGRLSLAIVVVGLVYLLTILKEYNGLDGTNTGERIFLALISTGGMIGVTTYTKKKTACSALSAILFVMIMISAITMYFTELSNTSLHATAESREDAAPIGP